MIGVRNIKQWLEHRGEVDIPVDAVGDGNSVRDIRGVSLRPFRHGRGMEGAKRLFSGDSLADALHNPSRKKEQVQTGLFEIHLTQTDGIEFYSAIIGSGDVGSLSDVYNSAYPQGEAVPETLPDLYEAEKSIAGGVVEFEADATRPLRTPWFNPKFDKPPYQQLLSTLAELASDTLLDSYRVVVQIYFKPGVGEEDETAFEQDCVSLSESIGSDNRSASRAIRAKSDASLFLLTTRFAVIADSEQAKRSIEEYGGEIFTDVFDNPATDQSLSCTPVVGNGLVEFYEALANRNPNWDEQPSKLNSQHIVSHRELAALAHLPSQVDLPVAVDWVEDDPLAAVPRTDPSFSAFVAPNDTVEPVTPPIRKGRHMKTIGNGYDGIVDTGGTQYTVAGKKARQRIDNSTYDPSQPLWIGTGTVDERDVSVSQSQLDRGLTVIGSDETRKRGLFELFSDYLTRSGEGLVYINTTESESPRPLAAVPEYRESDLHVLNLDETARSGVGVNMLQPVGEPTGEALDQQASEICESVFTLLGIERLLSGDEKLAIETLIEVFVKSDHPYTLADIINVVTKSEARARVFKELENETTSQQILSDSNADIKSTIGSLGAGVKGELTRSFNDTLGIQSVRNAIATRDPQISLPDILRDNTLLYIEAENCSQKIRDAVLPVYLHRLRLASSQVGEKERDYRSNYCVIDSIERASGGDSLPLGEVKDICKSDISTIIGTSEVDEGNAKLQSILIRNNRTKVVYKTYNQGQAKRCARVIGVPWERLHKRDDGDIERAWGVVGDCANPSKRFQFRTFAGYPPLKSKTELDAVVRQSQNYIDPIDQPDLGDSRPVVALTGGMTDQLLESSSSEQPLDTDLYRHHGGMNGGSSENSSLLSQLEEVN